LQIETIQNQGEAIPIQEETHDAQEEVVPVISEAVPTVLPTPMVTSHIPVLQKNNFSMPLENVFDAIMENNIEGNYMPVLSPVKNTHLDISSIVAPDNAKIDPVLQKDLNFMQTWLAKAAETETPFIEVVSKSQKKKRIYRLYRKLHSEPALDHHSNEYIIGTSEESATMTLGLCLLFHDTVWFWRKFVVS